MSQPFPAVRINLSRFDLNQNRAVSESPFTRHRQVTSLGAGTADRWEGLITTPVLYPADVRLMMNFLVKVGLYGRFTMEHPDYSGPDSGEADGLVNGAGQSGKSLDCDDFTPSTLILSEGEYFQVGDEFKRVTADATSDGAGEVTFEFEPALRVSPADNDTVILNNPVFLAELMTLPSEETDELGMAPFQIPFQEAIVGG